MIMKNLPVLNPNGLHYFHLSCHRDIKVRLVADKLIWTKVLSNHKDVCPSIITTSTLCRIIYHSCCCVLQDFADRVIIDTALLMW